MDKEGGKKSNKKRITTDVLLTEYKETRAIISDLHKIGESWGKIMIPLSLAILVLAINVIETLPLIGIFLLIFLSASTIIIWRLVHYSALYRIKILYRKINEIQKSLEIEDYFGKHYDPYWKLFIPRLTLKGLLNIFGLLFISVGIAVVIIKWLLF